MNEVVDILESLQTRDESLESGGSSVTLNEIPRSISEASAENKRATATSKSERDAETPISRPANGRSKSEPPKKFELYTL